MNQESIVRLFQKYWIEIPQSFILQAINDSGGISSFEYFLLIGRASCRERV